LGEEGNQLLILSDAGGERWKERRKERKKEKTTAYGTSRLASKIKTMFKSQESRLKIQTTSNVRSYIN
jgi:hypothetical protein